MPQPGAIDASEFAADNQRNLRRLVLSVQASLHKLNLLIAICDNPFYRDELIRTYEAELQSRGVACFQVMLNRQQPSLKQSLLDWQKENPDWQPQTPTLITVLGGDELLGIRLQQAKSAQERFFFSVQWTREGLREFPLPIVLWVTEAVAQGLAQQAPDFWSWRGGVFEFVQPMTWQVPDLTWRMEQSQLEPTTNAAPLADPAELEQQIAALEAEDPDSPLLASLYQSLGETYYERLERGIAVDRSQEEVKAIDAFQSAIARQEELAEPAAVAASLNYLGLLYKYQGRYAEAEPLLQRSLEIAKHLWGDEHLDVATSLNNLAGLYRSQGHYGEAEPLYQQALALRQQLLGGDNPDVATSLNNLAGLYELQGRYTEAEPLYRQALALTRQLLGSDHPDVATSLNNLAGLYQSQGRYTEAEPLYSKALALRQQLFGSDHPDVAISLNNLADLYRAQGRYTEAEPLYQQALALMQQLLGTNHPTVAISLNNLAALYESQERYVEAEPLYQQALLVSVQALGEDHPDVAIRLGNLGRLYVNQDRFAEAEPLLLDALRTFYGRLGKEHPYTQETIRRLFHLVQQAVNAGQTAALSDAPIIQELLSEMQS